MTRSYRRSRCSTCVIALPPTAVCMASCTSATLIWNLAVCLRSTTMLRLGCPTTRNRPRSPTPRTRHPHGARQYKSHQDRTTCAIQSLRQQGHDKQEIIAGRTERRQLSFGPIFRYGRRSYNIAVTRWLVAAAVAASATLTTAAPRVERAVPFHVGETLTYDVSWESFLTAGTLVATVREKKPSYDSTAYYIVVEGRPATLVSKLYSLYYKVDTLLDSYTLLSQRGATYSEEGSRHRYHATRFDRTARRAFFEDQRGDVKFDFAVSPSVQDPLAAIYSLRTTSLKTGERRTIPVSDGGTTFEVPIHVGALERVSTPAGDVNAWRVNASIPGPKGPSQAQNIVMWISDDGRRLPMRLQAEMSVGRFNLVLREAQ